MPVASDYYKVMTHSPNLLFLAALFVSAGLLHFVIPQHYTSIMPPWLPYHTELVYVSGILEMAGGIGILIPSLRRAAGVGLIALLVAVFPANVQMLMNSMGSHASSLSLVLLWLRLPLQPLLIVWVWKAVVRRQTQLPLTSL